MPRPLPNRVFAWEPLHAFMRRRYWGFYVPQRYAQGAAWTERLSTAEVAEVLGVSRRQVCRWAAHGLTPYEADRLAVKVGAHPAQVWPEWFELELQETG